MEQSWNDKEVVKMLEDEGYFTDSRVWDTVNSLCPVNEVLTAEKLNKLQEAIVRKFDTGATRDDDESKMDYEGFLSPLVLAEYARYMHTHRLQADGKLRASDNWQKGIPRDAYMKSMFRHFMDVWRAHRQHGADPGSPRQMEALCALLFNVFGYLHEELKIDGPDEAMPGTILQMLAGSRIDKGQMVVIDTENKVVMPVIDQTETGFDGPQD